MWTYALPAQYLTVVNSLSYYELYEDWHFRRSAISAAQKHGVMSRDTYEAHLMPLLLSRQITPMRWEDVVTLSHVDLEHVEAHELFQRMRGLYHAGRDEAAVYVGQAALKYRRPEVWFQGGWGLLSIANRVGRADRFVEAARLLLGKLARRPRLPANDLRAMACDVAKWLVEHNQLDAASKFYDPLIEHFSPHLDSLAPQVAASLLRGHGTLLLLRNRIQGAEKTYLRSLEYSGSYAEALIGTACWRAERQAVIGASSGHEKAWGTLEQRLNVALKPAPRRELEPQSAVSPQTLVSARLLACQRYRIEGYMVQFKEKLAECAEWVRQNHGGLAQFIVPGTLLAEATRHPRASATFAKLVRKPLRPEQLQIAVSLLQELGRRIIDDSR